jgi:cytochrome oxidase Cu insertion factor (SCO1/SenC/PrrC family)
MRKLVTLCSLVLLAVFLIGSPSLSQQGFTQEQLDAWQAVAATFYEEGIDENFMLGDPTLLDGMWGYINPKAIGLGMIAPDFTLINFEGEPFTLSDYIGEKFIVLVTGSWY